MLTDKIANFCSLINVAQKSKQSTVLVPYTKYNESIARAFLREGLLKSFENLLKENKIKLFLKYPNGHLIVKTVVRESKSKKHFYLSVKEILKYKKSTLFFLTTSKGILSNNEAILYGVGGKLIISVIA